MPVIAGNRFEGRHVDLRPYILYGEDIYVMPGGLTRVALKIRIPRCQFFSGRRKQGYVGAVGRGFHGPNRGRQWSRVLMLSRLADSLYWTSRYLERVENTARLVSVNSYLTVDLPAETPLPDRFGDRHPDGTFQSLFELQRARSIGFALYVSEVFKKSESPAQCGRGPGRFAEEEAGRSPE